MTDEETKKQQFANWLNQQLKQRDWTQGKLIANSGVTESERLSSAAVSRYCTGKMFPDVSSCQKIARAFNIPVEVVLRKAFLIDPLPENTDWLQRAIDDLAFAVEAGQLSEEGRAAIELDIRRERLLQELKGREDDSSESTLQQM